MPKRSLFAILCDLPWWVSLLVAGGVYLVGAMFMPLIGAAAAAPFVGVAAYVAWLRIKRGPTLDVPLTLKALRGATQEEMRALLAEAFGADRYQVADGPGGDLRLDRNGYVTLVRFRRWRAQSTTAAALRELGDAMRKQQADHGMYVTAGNVADDARAIAGESGIAMIDGAALAQMASRSKAIRRLIDRANQDAAKS